MPYRTATVPLTGEFSCALAGLANLVSLADRLSGLTNTFVRLDCRGITHVDSNMTAPLGAIIVKAKSQGCVVVLDNLPPPVRDSLQRIGFLEVGLQEDAKANREDRRLSRERDWPSTGRENFEAFENGVSYRSFDLVDSKSFAGHIQYYASRADISYLPNLFLKRIQQVFNEAFNNSSIHSKSEIGVFTSGRINTRVIEFTIVDLGIGIPQNVRRYLKRDVQPVVAIDWALSDENTTRSGDIPGGLGLKIIRKLIERHRGTLTILSGGGLWMLSEGKIERRHLRTGFPGTLLDIRIDAASVRTAEVTPDAAAQLVL